MVNKKTMALMNPTPETMAVRMSKAFWAKYWLSAALG